MKTLANLKELIDYCVTCPVCSKERNLNYEGDTHNDFIIHSYSYSAKEGILELSTTHRYESFQRAMKIESAEVNFKINCLTHTYHANIKASKKDIPNIKADIPNLFYFYIYANCPRCSSLDTIDLEIKNGKFVTAGIEREKFWMQDAQAAYSAEYLYKENKMEIKVFRPDAPKGSKPMTLPIYELDLSNRDDLASQIKNIIAFS